jgi:hypothetical protein
VSLGCPQTLFMATAGMMLQGVGWLLPDAAKMMTVKKLQMMLVKLKMIWCFMYYLLWFVNLGGEEFKGLRRDLRTAARTHVRGRTQTPDRIWI